MTMHLYKSDQANGHPTKLENFASANAGLWFSRFCVIEKENNNKNEDEKLKWLTKFVATNKNSQGSQNLLNDTHQRLLRLGQSLQASHAIFKLTSPLATGLGLNHPTENGFTFHPTLGVPYLPASSIKGLLRAWIEQWIDWTNEPLLNDAGQPENKIDLSARWFGKNADNLQDGCAGNLIFFDAIPTDTVTLTCDIMTPHNGRWYEQGGSIKPSDYATTLPADWHNPVPVPFLTLSRAKLLLMIAPRIIGKVQQDEQTQHDVKTALQQLELALEWLGAGAKTAAGYGRMENEEKAERIEQAKRDEGIVKSSGTVWKNAKLHWDKAKKQLKIQNGNLYSTINPPQSLTFFEKLSDATRAKLDKNKKFEPIEAIVDQKGNNYTLIELNEK